MLGSAADALGEYACVMIEGCVVFSTGDAGCGTILIVKELIGSGVGIFLVVGAGVDAIARCFSETSGTGMVCLLAAGVGVAL